MADRGNPELDLDALRALETNGLTLPDGRAVSYANLSRLGSKRWAAIVRAHCMIWGLTRAVELLCESDNTDDDLSKLFAKIHKLWAASSDVKPQSHALMFLTLAIENAASGKDTFGNVFPQEHAWILIGVFLISIGYADIGERLSESDAKRLVRVWRQEERYKGGKWRAILDCATTVIAEFDKKPKSHEREYREWKKTLPPDPHLIFGLHQTG